MNKKTEKQPQTLKSRCTKVAANGQARTSHPAAVLDLSHIAEALRPLAIRCSSINFDSDNARLDRRVRGG